MLRRVHLVRHGEADNPQRIIYGRLPGFGLSARGREQAARAAERLQGLVRGPVAFYVSPLDRAQQTAAILRQALGIAEHTTDERLSETQSALVGMHRKGKLADLVRRALRPSTWRANERPSAVAARMQDAVRAALEQTAHDVVIVSHQFPILMARVAFERRFMPWMLIRGRCELASITTLVFEGTTLHAVSYSGE
jgi:broad specificity phosphatase PhoE